AKRFRQVMPELEQPCVQHLGDSADVARALAVKVERAAAGVLEYFASAPSPSRSRNFIATSASRKSATPRGWRASSLPISAPVSRRCPSVVNRPNSTAVSKTLEFQKPKAVWRIASGVGADVFTKPI